MNVRFFVAVSLLLTSFGGAALADDAPAPPEVPWRRTVLGAAVVGSLSSLSRPTPAAAMPSAEFALTDRLSIVGQLELSWWGDHYAGEGSSWPAPTHGGAVGGELGLNAFLTGRAPQGLWVGARVGGLFWGSVLQGSESGDPLRSSTLSSDGSVLLGYTRIIDPGFSVSLAAGPYVGYSEQRWTTDSEMRWTTWSGGLRALASLGFAL